MNKKISQLGISADLTANDLFQVVDRDDTSMSPTGTNKRITAQTLGDYLPATATGSSASRTLKDRFADTVNVKDFGAVGDGVADDTGALQAAINTGKASLFFPDGKYLFSGFSLLSSVISSNCFGNGKLLYNNGSYIEFVGKQLRIGVNDPDGNLGTLTQGGLIIGGEGPSEDGVQFYGQQPAWMQCKTTQTGSGTEFQLYSNAFIGLASSVVSSAYIDSTYNNFSNENIEVGDVISFGNTEYLIKTKVSNTRLELQTIAGGTVLFNTIISDTFRHAYYYANGTCSTNGVNITRVNGDYFFNVSVGYSQKYIKINNVKYSVSTFNSSNSVTIATSAGIQTSVPFTQKYYNLAKSINTLKIQGLEGSSEETFSIYNTTHGENRIESNYAGNGKYLPIKISSGENPIGTISPQICLYPNSTLGGSGTLLLGGDFNKQAVNIPQNNNNVNYHYIQGGISGVSPSFAVRGSDTNVGIGLDTQGTGAVTFTSNSYSKIEFQIFGNGGTSWLGISSDSTAAPAISSQGSSANIDLKLVPKGTGNVRFGTKTSSGDAAITGYITIKDQNGNSVKLAVIG